VRRCHGRHRSPHRRRTLTFATLSDGSMTAPQNSSSPLRASVRPGSVYPKPLRCNRRRPTPATSAHISQCAAARFRLTSTAQPCPSSAVAYSVGSVLDSNPI
jgi:hypothetical protein